MKILSYFLAVILGALGFIFLVGSQGQPARLIIGIVLWSRPAR